MIFAYFLQIRPMFLGFFSGGGRQNETMFTIFLGKIHLFGPHIPVFLTYEKPPSPPLGLVEGAYK